MKAAGYGNYSVFAAMEDYRRRQNRRVLTSSLWLTAWLTARGIPIAILGVFLAWLFNFPMLPSTFMGLVVGMVVAAVRLYRS